MSEQAPVPCRFCGDTDTVLEESPVYGRGYVRWRCRSCGLADSSFEKPRPAKPARRADRKQTRERHHSTVPPSKRWWLDRDERIEGALA